MTASVSPFPSHLSEAWAADKNNASYVWEQLSPGGAIVLVTEWNQDFTAETPLRAIADEVVHQVGPPDPISGVRNTVSTWRVRAACKMRARPLRPGELPVLEIDLEAGDELVWTHRQVNTLALMNDGAQHVEVAFKTMLFGRIPAAATDGAGDIAQIFPNGEVIGHKTIDEALAQL